MLTKAQVDYIKTVASKHPEVPTSKLLSYLSKDMRVGVTSNDLTQIVGLRKVKGFYKPSASMPARTRSHPVTGLSREQFANTFDGDTRIRNSLTKVVAWLDAQDEIFDDAQVRAKCSCPTSGWRMVAVEPEFKKYQFCIKNRLFWASRATRSWALNNVQGASEL